MNGIIELKRKLPSEKGKHQILKSEFGESTIQRHISIAERDPDQQQEWKISRCTTVRPKCAEWDEEQEEFARQRAYKLHKELSKTNGHCKDIHKTKFLQK